MWPVWFGKIRANGSPDDKYDVLEIIDRREPHEIAVPAAEAGKLCSLGWPS